MSVARAAYRQLLRVGKRVSNLYDDPNDLCFALFGVLVSRQDFVNAGYGNTFPSILRTCFLRPSVKDDVHDTQSARTNAAFDALRRLHELKASNAAFRIRELRRTMVEKGDKRAGQRPRVASLSSTTPRSHLPEDAMMGHNVLEDADDVSTAAATPAAATAAAAENPSLSTTPMAAKESAGPPRAPVTHSLDEEGVHLIQGSVLIERTSRRRIHSFTRHCVVCEPINMTFPPYRFCVPPEPAYLLAVRSRFALYAITDVLLAIAATSIFRESRQAHPLQLPEPHSSIPSPSAAATPKEREEESIAAAVIGGEGKGSTHTYSEGLGATSSTEGNTGPSSSSVLSPPPPRGFPTSHEDLAALIYRIPTRTVVQTNVLEVEVTTEYVCANQSAVGKGVVASEPGLTAVLHKDTSKALGASPRHDSSSTPISIPHASPALGNVGEDGNAYLFIYYVHIRNRGPQVNPKRWHAQVISHHLVVIDVAVARVLEVGRPGVLGNFPFLAPGSSHCFESGTTLSGREGILRGSIQVNLFNDAGEVIMLDAAIAPTRLTCEVTSAHELSSARAANGELVQRSVNSLSPSLSRTPTPPNAAPTD